MARAEARATGRGRTGIALLAGLVLLGSGCLSPAVGARMILEPQRHAVQDAPTPPHEEVAFRGDGVDLRGWLFRTTAPRRGVVIYLHGRNQTRDASLVAVERLLPLGYDVLAYDSRAHGASGGTYSTFGYYEKRDVSDAIDFLGVDRVVLVGLSLGAAVAIQAAAEDPRVVGVVAAASFPSMDSVVRDRLPRFVPEAGIRSVFRAVESKARMRVAEASAVDAAPRVRVPVLLLQGSDDRFTPPARAESIYRALGGPREMVLVPGAHHADVLRFDGAWTAILAWMQDQLGVTPPAALALGTRRRS